MVSLNKLIVLEGSGDGVGKSTQLKLLKHALIKEGYKVTNCHFPSYGEPSAAGVELYLQGKLGEIKDLSPYFINNLYAHNRAIVWQTQLRPAYENGDTILLDRYTTSSLIYQAATYESLEEKKEYINYTMDYEYNKLGIKEPDQVLYLWGPYDLLRQMILKRYSNDGVANDIYERNEAFLKKVYETSMFVADYLKWDHVDCAPKGKLLSIEEIHQKVYSLVKK